LAPAQAWALPAKMDLHYRRQWLVPQPLQLAPWLFEANKLNAKPTLQKIMLVTLLPKAMSPQT
jgi:hypothetical protein